MFDGEASRCQSRNVLGVSAQKWRVGGSGVGRGGKSSLLMTKPLIIYEDKEHKTYTYDMNYIMENGAFPEGFSR